MNKMSSFLALVIGLLIAGSAFADWIEDSDRNSMVALRSQAAFAPESVARAGLSEFDADVIDLNVNDVAASVETIPVENQTVIRTIR